MNTKGNARRKASEERMEQAFLELASVDTFQKISVRAICARAGVNRSTFYGHYTDIYDLLEKTEKRLSARLKEIVLRTCGDAPWDLRRMFRETFAFVGKYQDFYKACFAGHIPVSAFSLIAEEPFSGRIAEFTEKYQFYSSEKINYHVMFFRAGIIEIFRAWLEHGCIEPPEEMAGIVFDEYQAERHDMEMKL